MTQRPGGPPTCRAPHEKVVPPKCGVMGEWKSIETAPDDGTSVLVSDGKRVWMSSRHKGRRSRDGMPLDGRDWSYSWPAHYPTHWMFLPEPSKDALK